MQYIRQQNCLLHTNLLTSGKLNGYLTDVDKQADEMFSRLAKQMAECEEVTERLKAENPMEWVGQMKTYEMPWGKSSILN